MKTNVTACIGSLCCQIVLPCRACSSKGGGELSPDLTLGSEVAITGLAGGDFISALLTSDCPRMMEWVYRGLPFFGPRNDPVLVAVPVHPCSAGSIHCECTRDTGTDTSQGSWASAGDAVEARGG